VGYFNANLSEGKPRLKLRASPCGLRIEPAISLLKSTIASHCTQLTSPQGVENLNDIIDTFFLKKLNGIQKEIYIIGRGILTS
jgi:hypothetical protein